MGYFTFLSFISTVLKASCYACTCIEFCPRQLSVSHTHHHMINESSGTKICMHGFESCFKAAQCNSLQLYLRGLYIDRRDGGVPEGHVDGRDGGVPEGHVDRREGGLGVHEHRRHHGRGGAESPARHHLPTQRLPQLQGQRPLQ